MTALLSIAKREQCTSHPRGFALCIGLERHGEAFSMRICQILPKPTVMRPNDERGPGDANGNSAAASWNEGKAKTRHHYFAEKHSQETENRVNLHARQLDRQQPRLTSLVAQLSLVH